MEKGQKDDTFILTHVADVPGASGDQWAASSTGSTGTPRRSSRRTSGHQIRIGGTITDVDQARDGNEGRTTTAGRAIVEIEGPGRNVRTSAAKAGVAAEPPSEATIKTTLVKLKVDKIEMVSAAAPDPLADGPRDIGHEQALSAQDSVA